MTYSRWLVCILLLLAPVALAQDKHYPPVLPQVREALPKLGLSADQKARIDQLFADTQKKLDACLSEPNPQSREVAAKAIAAVSALAEGIEQTLTPEQMAKLRTLMEGTPATSPVRPPATRPDLSTLIPLTELGKKKHQGFEGGLYPGGRNVRPTTHEAAGLALAKQVVPRDDEGKPAADGKIALLSIGMTNASEEFWALQRLPDLDRLKNPKVVIVNGALHGATAAAISNPDDPYRGASMWAEVDRLLTGYRVTAAQVQVVWLKEYDERPTDEFPKHAQTLQEKLTKTVQVIHARFANAKIVYLSSRSYGGYDQASHEPEPLAYENGFSVKWLIEQQIKGDAALNFDPAKGEVKAPWLSWGPYLWANGTTRRADGLSYDRGDFVAGTCPSVSGREKVAKLLLEFFKSDSTAKGWFTLGQ